LVRACIIKTNQTVFLCDALCLCDLVVRKTFAQRRNGAKVFSLSVHACIIKNNQPVFSSCHFVPSRLCGKKKIETRWHKGAKFFFDMIFKMKKV
jgi:hypothetical protein